MTAQTLYKVLAYDLHAMHGGSAQYTRGEWTEHLDPTWLEACRYGYHLVPLDELIDWMGPTIWEADPCPDHAPVEEAGKVVTCAVRLVRQTAWDDTAARLFAADCAEMALLGERARGREPDERSWRAVEVVRASARGEATESERAAAEDAAEDAARAAACAAAWDAAWAAAWAAAGDAAWDAARVAAWDAARAAAEDAAEDAARAAARERMAARLAAYLTGSDPGRVTPLYGEEVPA